MPSNQSWTILLLAMCLGCASPGWHFGRRCVDAQLYERTGESLGPPTCPGDVGLPPGLECSDGVLEAEAVLAALWNNANFQQLLVDLEVARSDVIQARQLTNPELWSVFPVGVKQLEFAFNVPLDAFWLRPRRVAAAELESKRIGQRLVQDGLNLIRDVRVAHVDLCWAQERLRLTEESARLREQIARLSEARLRAGDASELEVSTLRLDGMMGREEARRAVYDVDLARQRLTMLMGIQSLHVTIDCAVASPLPQLPCGLDGLLGQAIESRPDLLAADLAVGAAAQRARLAKIDYLRVIGVLPDANGRGEKGFEAGPGVLFTVPLFHQNQGAIARAQAELERAQRNCDTLRDTIELEVRQALTRMAQAETEASAWRERIVPLALDAVKSADNAYRGGGASLFLVMETSRQLLAAQQRQAQAESDLRRAAAELDRAVGRHVTSPALPDEQQGDVVEELLP